MKQRQDWTGIDSRKRAEDLKGLDVKQEGEYENKTFGRNLAGEDLWILK
jgi:hypothetical protein